MKAETVIAIKAGAKITAKDIAENPAIAADVAQGTEDLIRRTIGSNPEYKDIAEDIIKKISPEYVQEHFRKELEDESNDSSKNRPS